MLVCRSAFLLAFLIVTVSGAPLRFTTPLPSGTTQSPSSYITEDVTPLHQALLMSALIIAFVMVFEISRRRNRPYRWAATTRGFEGKDVMILHMDHDDVPELSDICLEITV